MLKLLFIGDIVGRPGRDILAERLARLRTERSIDFVIANGENAAAGVEEAHRAGRVGNILTIQATRAAVSSPGAARTDRNDPDRTSTRAVPSSMSTVSP